VVGHGATTVVLGNAGNIQDIVTTLELENSADYNGIILDDSADTTARTTTVQTLGFINGDDFEHTGEPWGIITGLAPGAIIFEYADPSGVTINTGKVAGNVVNVRATGVTTYAAGHARTTINVGNAGSVQEIRAPLYLENRPDYNDVFIDDSSDPNSRTATV